MGESNNKENQIINYHKLLSAATDVGYMLLENGAEIYRVEESIQRILQAYGLKQVEVFAIPSCIIVTISTDIEKNITKTRRLYSRGTNFDKVEQANDLCRRICTETPPVEHIQQELARIDGRPVYGTMTQILAFGLVAFGFTLFFGGTFWDALSATVIASAIKVVIHNMERFEANPFFVNIVASWITAFLAILAVRYQLAQNVDKMIIGTLMNLVPGVAITNSMRDIIAGDLIAGLIKMTEALMVATAIAIGTAMALAIIGG